MILNKKNDGTYVPYLLTNTVLSFRGGALELDLSQYERDYPVSLDIVEDASCKLVLGLSEHQSGRRRYMAQLDIPARTYTINVGAADDFGFPKLKKSAVPLDTALVTLTLWAMEV